MKEDLNKNLNQSAEQPLNKEQQEKNEVLQSLDNCLQFIKEKSESKRTKREKWILKSINDAKERIEQTGENQVEIKDDNGEVIYSKAEGLPVEELADYLEDKIKRKKTWINKLEGRIAETTQKKDEKQVEKASSEEPGPPGGTEAACWYEVYTGLAEDDLIKRKAEKFIKEWCKADDQDYSQDQAQIAEAMRQAIKEQQKNLDGKVIEVKTIKDNLDALKGKSAKFSELHPEAWGDDKQWHKRVELEAHYISKDYRAKKNWQEDYKLAEKIMKKRLELILPGIDKAEIPEKSSPERGRIAQLKQEINEINQAVGSGEIFNTYGSAAGFDFQDPQRWAEEEVRRREEEIRRLEGASKEEKEGRSPDKGRGGAGKDKIPKEKEPSPGGEASIPSKEGEGAQDKVPGQEEKPGAPEKEPETPEGDSIPPAEDGGGKEPTPPEEKPDVPEEDKEPVPPEQKPETPEEEPEIPEEGGALPEEGGEGKRSPGRPEKPDESGEYGKESGPSLRRLANYRKLKEKNPDMPDDEIEEHIKYAETSEAGQELVEQMDVLADQIAKTEEELNQEELEGILNEIAQKTGLYPEDIKGIYDYHIDNIQAQAEAKVRAATSTKRKILTTAAKILGYGGAGLAIGVATGGAGWLAYGGVAALGGVRVMERWKGGKRHEEEAKEQADNIRNELATKSETRKEATRNILAQIATLKQKQIDGREDSPDERSKKIEEAKKAYLDNPSDENKIEFLNRVNEKKEEMGYTLAVYLEKLDVPEEQREQLIQASHGLYQIDEENSLLEQQEAAKKPNFFRKAVNSVNKFLGSKWLRGGENAREKAATTSVFVGMGLAARELPVVRNVLMGYAGMKAGELAGNFATAKFQRYELLKQLRAENVDKETINQARAQLQDEEFKTKNPVQYALLRESVDRHEQSNLHEVSQQEQQRKAQKLKAYLENRNSELEDTIQKRNKLKQEKKVINVGFQAVGAAAGWLIGDQLAPEADKKPDAQEQPEQTEQPEKTQPEAVPKKEQTPPYSVGPQEYGDKTLSGATGEQTPPYSVGAQEYAQKTPNGPEGEQTPPYGVGPQEYAEKTPTGPAEEQTPPYGVGPQEYAGHSGVEQALPYGVGPEYGEAEDVFEIADNVNIEKGDSVWTVGEKYLNGNPVYKEIVNSAQGDTKEALVTHNIDRLKDVIAENPSDYGLDKSVDPDKLSLEDLKGLNWQKAFNEVFREKGLTDELSEDQIDSIIENNDKLQEYYTEHPDAPHTSEYMEKILAGQTKEAEAAKEAVQAGGRETAAGAKPDIQVDLGEGEGAEKVTKGTDIKSHNETFSHTAKENLNERVKEIYKVWLGPDQVEEWGVIKDNRAVDVMAGDFGETVGNSMDLGELNNRQQLLDYMKEAKDSIGDPQRGESVEEYLTRYEKGNITEQLGQETSATGAETAPEEAAQAGEQSETVAEKATDSSKIEGIQPPEEADDFVKNNWEDVAKAVENGDTEFFTGFDKGQIADKENNLEGGLIRIIYNEPNLKSMEIDFDNKICQFNTEKELIRTPSWGNKDIQTWNELRQHINNLLVKRINS